eukprot:gene19957-32158_t
MPGDTARYRAIPGDQTLLAESGSLLPGTIVHGAAPSAEMRVFAASVGAFAPHMPLLGGVFRGSGWRGEWREMALSQADAAQSRHFLAQSTWRFWFWKAAVLRRALQLWPRRGALYIDCDVVLLRPPPPMPLYIDCDAVLLRPPPPMPLYID